MISCFEKENMPNILGLSEHWLDSGEIDCYRSIGDLAYADGYFRKIHQNGGVFLCVKRGFNYKQVNVSQFCSEIHIELCAIELTDLNMIVILAYRSPNGDTEVFFEALDKCLCFFTNLRPTKRIVLGGDFNIVLDAHSADRHSFEVLLRGQGLYITNYESKRGDKCLDTIATNLDTWDYNTEVSAIIIADHAPVEITIRNQEVSDASIIAWHESYLFRRRLI